MATQTMTDTAPPLPPFPDNVPTAPLLRLSLRKLLGREEGEVARFNRACDELGFFYLDLDGPGDAILRDANELLGVAERLYDLPLEEKLKYDFSAENSYFGYKALGAAVVDRKGNLDRNEFYNVVATLDCRPRAGVNGQRRFPKTTSSAIPRLFPLQQLYPSPALSSNPSSPRHTQSSPSSSNFSTSISTWPPGPS